MQLLRIQAYLRGKNNRIIRFLRAFYRAWPHVCVALPGFRDHSVRKPVLRNNRDKASGANVTAGARAFAAHKRGIQNSVQHQGMLAQEANRRWASSASTSQR